MNYKITYCCVSHIGNIRKVNQDNFICNGEYMDLKEVKFEFPLTGELTSEKPCLFGIFDGMGGEECGEVASFIAGREAAVVAFDENRTPELARYCETANSEICLFASENSVSSTGTTAAMLSFVSDKIYLCNIGDSKIFSFVDGGLLQLSKDHVVPGNFSSKPPLSQSLGIPPTEMIIEPYITEFDYEAGAKYLICSDGLTDMVSTQDIANVLQTEDVKNATRVLLETALANGGRDNTTIILISVEKIKKTFWDFLKKFGGKK